MFKNHQALLNILIIKYSYHKLLKKLSKIVLDLCKFLNFT